MVMRKEDTPKRIAQRRYEEKNKEKRRAANGNFQTMIPRPLFEEINAFLKKYKITKVELIRSGYKALLAREDLNLKKLDGKDDFSESENKTK